MVNVLVVADGPWVLNDVRAALDDGRFEISEHSDPRTVAEAAVEVQPDLVVVDLQIGSMGGMAVIRRLREANAPTPPVIMLLDRAADTFLARRAGADAWVRKPLDGFELRDLADRLLAAAHPEVEPA